mmetsp:Transcript_90893/g.294090  ORF Transcript_90893/g.294090 Transcript_90893/m.294090 type:complete len:257 (+) Transcript_90893:132-902(+)
MRLALLQLGLLPVVCLRFATLPVRSMHSGLTYKSTSPAHDWLSTFWPTQSRPLGSRSCATAVRCHTTLAAIRNLDILCTLLAALQVDPWSETQLCAYRGLCAIKELLRKLRLVREVSLSRGIRALYEATCTPALPVDQDAVQPGWPVGVLQADVRLDANIPCSFLPTPCIDAEGEAEHCSCNRLLAINKLLRKLRLMSKEPLAWIVHAMYETTCPRNVPLLQGAVQARRIEDRLARRASVRPDVQCPLLPTPGVRA